MLYLWIMEKKVKREFKPKYNEELLGVNPFTKKLVVPVSLIPFKGNYKKDKDGDLIPVEVEVDGDVCCKVFVDKRRRLRMNVLSPRAKELLLWLFYEVNTNEDYIWIHRTRYMQELSISSMNTYRAAVNELIQRGILIRTCVNAVYWIDPDLFFNGNRVNKYKMHLKYR